MEAEIEFAIFRAREYLESLSGIVTHDDVDYVISLFESSIREYKFEDLKVDVINNYDGKDEYFCVR